MIFRDSDDSSAPSLPDSLDSSRSLSRSEAQPVVSLDLAQASEAIPIILNVLLLALELDGLWISDQDFEHLPIEPEIITETSCGLANDFELLVDGSWALETSSPEPEDLQFQVPNTSRRPDRERS